jgi:hypothetical protein
MKIIFKILSSRIVVIGATIAMLYNIFQSTKDNPNSIAHQLSGKNLEKNFSAVKKTVPRIMEAKKQSSNQQEQPSNSPTNP